MATVVAGRRLGALALACALVAACGADPKKPTPPTTSTSAVTAPTTSGGAPSSSTTTRRATAATTPSGASPTAVAPAPSTEVADAAQVNPGGFAGVLLAPGPADRIELDVLVQTGVDPDRNVLARIVDILRQQSGKPVAMLGPRAVSAGTVHSAEEIRTLADERGSRQGHDNTAVIHLLYLAGQYERNDVLGVGVRGDTTAIFPAQIASAATPLVRRARIEESVVVHEIGHLLGLVDLFRDTGRDDPDHPGHSKNPKSVMYWAVESSLVAQALDGPPPVDFDSADLADLAAIRGGAH